MTEDELRNTPAPFLVKYRGEMPPLRVIGFKQNDPLGVGGGLFQDIPVCYFEKGGWLLVTDLLRHYEMVTPHGWAGIGAQARREAKP